MARFLLVACFFLANNSLLSSLAMANAPAPSPSNSSEMAMAAAQAQPTWSLSPPASSDDEEAAMKTVKAPVEEAAGKDSNSIHSRGEEQVSMNQPGLGEPDKEESELVDEPSWANRRLGKHHLTDKSIAGAEVILGGLAATFLVSIICYIRVTKRRDGESTTMTPAY